MALRNKKTFGTFDVKRWLHIIATKCSVNGHVTDFSQNVTSIGQQKYFLFVKNKITFKYSWKCGSYQYAKISDQTFDVSSWSCVLLFRIRH